MKSKVSFVCQECGYESPEWLGKCPECGVWNSLREIYISKSTPVSLSTRQTRLRSHESSSPKRLDEIKSEEKQRLKTSFSEFDNVLGGGIVKGSVILLAGDPGVGKSTLLLQIAINLAGSPHPLDDSSKPSGNTRKAYENASASPAVARSNHGYKETVKRSSRGEVRPVLYISGEESEDQIKLRAERIKKDSNTSKNLLVLSSSNTDNNCDIIQNIKPQLAIIDSIQTMESENLAGISGSVGQIRYSAFQFIKLAKTLNIPIIIVGHVTKEGMVAGPMVLSHMVDTVLFLEGEKLTTTRILRSFKNRFGSVDEVGIFTLSGKGLEESKNPEQFFLTKNIDSNVTGSIISVAMEGSRAILIEIQALVLPSKLPIPRRVVQGIDYKRLELLIAVIQKLLFIPLSGMDIFINVAGGIKLKDPGIDLAVCLAIISSFKNKSVSEKVAISEIGLLGELRSVSFLHKRINEAKKLGFRDIISRPPVLTLKDAVKLVIK